MSATHLWRWNTRLPERKGTGCVMLARGRLNSCLIQFVADGWKCITSRNAVRKIKRDHAPQQVAKS